MCVRNISNIHFQVKWYKLKSVRTNPWTVTEQQNINSIFLLHSSQSGLLTFVKIRTEMMMCTEQVKWFFTIVQCVTEIPPLALSRSACGLMWARRSGQVDSRSPRMEASLCQHICLTPSRGQCWHQCTHWAFRTCCLLFLLVPFPRLAPWCVLVIVLIWSKKRKTEL